jgi:hypothetical protein
MPASRPTLKTLSNQLAQLRAAGCKKVFSEVASGAKIECAQLRRSLNELDARDVLSVTRLDRLARSTPKASTFITQAHDYVISQHHRVPCPLSRGRGLLPLSQHSIGARFSSIAAIGLLLAAPGCRGTPGSRGTTGSAYHHVDLAAAATGTDEPALANREHLTRRSGGRARPGRVRPWWRLSRLQTISRCRLARHARARPHPSRAPPH